MTARLHLTSVERVPDLARAARLSHAQTVTKADRALIAAKTEQLRDELRQREMKL